MGCAGSKPAEDQPAVALCRRRCQYLQHAIDHRYNFAKAHADYRDSLHAVAEALSAFFLAEPGNPGASPVLTLPNHYKAKGVAPPVGNPIPPLSPPAKPPPQQPVPIAAAANHHQPSRSNSGSHLHFMDSESDSDDGPLHSDHGTPYYQQLPKNNPYDPFPAMNNTTTTFFNFAQKAAPGAVTYQQRPYDLASVQVGNFDSSGGDPPTAYPSYGSGDSYSNNPNNYYGAGASSSSASSFPFAYPSSYQYPAPNGSSGGGGAGGGGFFDPSPSQPPQAGTGSSSSTSGPRAPLPPPSPPKASTWDFINVFDSYDSYYPNNYTPSRSSRDLREEEGIPELEEEEQEVVKEVYVQAKSAGDAPSDEGPRRSVGDEVHYKMRSVPENDVAQAAGMSAAAAGGNVRQQDEAFKRNIVPGSRSVPDTVQLVKAMFERSSMAAEEVRDVLEVGKIQYHQRKYQVVSSKLMRPITSPVSVFSSSLASTAVSSEESDIASSLRSEFGELEPKSLSCVLHKLLIWETKLLDEVKAEEDMQLRLEKKRRKLKRLDDEGAESSKIDATRKTVKDLSTRLKVAIQVVETISNKINMLRDGELWKELQELIQGLVKIWKAMAECHRVQCQAIIESRSLDVVTAVRLSDAQSDAITQLVVALHRWSVVFSGWVGAQKMFIHSLNEWLKHCIRDEPEETVDGPVPFSPGRLGAPPVFVICNNWEQALGMVSESEVVHAMGLLKATMKHIWDRHCDQVTFASSPGDRSLKEIESKRQKLLRELGEQPARKKQQGQLAGVQTYKGEVADVGQAIEPGNLKSNLQQVFEAMERFTDSSTRAYEGLWARCREENMPRENAGPS